MSGAAAERAGQLAVAEGIRPFIGLEAFGEKDAEFFFSRDAERDIVLSNFMAHRLLLVYGGSGVGKSSLLRAGVVHALERIARSNVADGGMPELAVAVLDSWRDDPVPALKQRVREAIRRLVGGDAALPAAELAFQPFLAAAAECVGGELFLVLDQFEEYFLYHPADGREESFDVEFPRAVQDRSLPVSFLISMRDDSLARLDRFRGAIPHLLANRVPLDYLDRAGARDAILKPIAKINTRHPGLDLRIDDALVERILDEVEVGQVSDAEAGLGGTAVRSGRVATAYLQLVMQQLWDEAIGSGSRELRFRSLTQEAGGVQAIVQLHLDATVDVLPPDEQDVAARVFRHLITPSGTKYAYGVSDLAELTGLPTEAISGVLRQLSTGTARILRNLGPPPGDRNPHAERFQIYHDVLASPVLGWLRRRTEAQRQERIRREEQERQEEIRRRERAEQERAQVRMLRVGIGVLCLTVLVLAGALFYADAQRRHAQESLNDLAAAAEATGQRLA
jgi:hypothetical protein